MIYRFEQKSFRMSIWLMVCFVLMLSLPFAVQAKDKAKAEFHKELNAKDIKTVYVETTNGEINVIGQDMDQVVIYAQYSVTGPKKKICEELLQKIEFKITEDNNKLRIEAETPKKFKYSSQVSFDLKVPSRVKLDAESTNGGIIVENLTGGLAAQTTNGAIQCSNISGDIEAETVNGEISLDDIDGDTDASAVNGAVKCSFNKKSPKAVNIETVNGAITLFLKDVPDAVIDAETINGSLRIGGKKIKKTGIIGNSFSGKYGSGNGRYNLETVNGSIEIDMPEID